MQSQFPSADSCGVLKIKSTDLGHQKVKFKYKIHSNLVFIKLPSDRRASQVFLSVYATKHCWGKSDITYLGSIEYLRVDLGG